MYTLKHEPDHLRPPAPPLRRPNSAECGTGLGTIQSVERASAVLRAVASALGEGMRLTAVADRTGLHVATARRLLQTMVGEGILTFDRRRKLYRIGPTIYAYAAAASPWYGQKHLFEAAMDLIAQRSGDTVMLSVPAGNEAVCLMRQDGDYPIRIMTLKVGSRRPLGVGSAGLVLLGSMLPGERDAVVQAVEADYAQFGVTASDVLSGASEAARRGYSVNHGLIIPGIVGIAVAAMSRGKPVAAISVAGTDRRMTKDHRIEVVQIIREEIGRIPGIDC